MNRESGEDGDADPTVIVGAADDDTVVVDRRGPDDDATVVVLRSVAEDDETVIVATEIADESTILIDRPHPDEEATVLVDRDADVDDSTLPVIADEDVTPSVARAAAGDSDDTVSVSTDAPRVAAAPDDEATIIVGDDATVQVGPRAEPTVEYVRPGATVPVEGVGAAQQTDDLAGAGSTPVRPSMAPPRKRRRDELQPAPVPSGFGGMPLVASGAGAVSSYRARTLLAPPTRAAVQDSAAPRRLMGEATSVGRRSRRESVAAIAVVVGATVLLAGAVVWSLSALIGF